MRNMESVVLKNPTRISKLYGFMMMKKQEKIKIKFFHGEITQRMLLKSDTTLKELKDGIIPLDPIQQY